MKRVLCSVFSILLIFSLMVTTLSLNVSAASVSSSGGNYEVGQKVKVSISYKGDAALYAVEVTAGYNSSVLRLDSVSGVPASDVQSSNGTVKFIDDNFSPNSKTSSYTLNFTAVAAGNSNVSISAVGSDGDAEFPASTTAKIAVVAKKPSANANLSSIKLSSGALSPAFNANTTSYTATVKYSVDKITVTGAVADGKSTYTGGGTFDLKVGDNERVLTVTAEDGTKKTYTVNIKRMTEQETADAEAAEREANPTLVVIEGKDYTITNDFGGMTIPTGFTVGKATRKETELTVLNDEHGEYTLYWLVDNAGENGAFYTRDENDIFKRVSYIRSNGKMYIVEKPDIVVEYIDKYVKADRVIDGAEVVAYNFVDEALKDFCIVRCYVGGQRAYYRFDSAEGTMQRAIEFEQMLKQPEAEPDTDTNTQSTNSVLNFANMSKTGKAVLLIVALTAVIFIIIAVLVIIKITSPKDDDFEEEFIPFENDDFVLSDFSEDEFEDEFEDEDEDEFEDEDDNASVE